LTRGSISCPSSQPDSSQRWPVVDPPPIGRASGLSSTPDPPDSQYPVLGLPVRWCEAFQTLTKSQPFRRLGPQHVPRTGHRRQTQRQNTCLWRNDRLLRIRAFNQGFATTSPRRSINVLPHRAMGALHWLNLSTMTKYTKPRAAVNQKS
jgi:hypothetical protein